MRTEQRIEIKNLGPVKNVCLDVKDFMIFVGPQASGKSTIAKAIYFFKSLKQFISNKILFNYITSSVYDDTETTILKCKKLIRESFRDCFDYDVNDELMLRYYYEENIWISIMKKNNDELTVHFSTDFEIKMSKLLEQCFQVSYAISQMSVKVHISQTLRWEDYDFEQKKQWDYIKKRYNEILKENRELIFIPAVRSELNIARLQAITDIDNNVNVRAKFLGEDVNKFREHRAKHIQEIIKKPNYHVNSTQINKLNLAVDLVRKVLKGEFRIEEGEERIYFTNNQYVPLSIASSGQQEAIWILLMLFTEIVYQHSAFMVIEEPEAHLFPDTQKEIVNLMALFSNIPNSQLIITTHSPYILASINNLIYAHKIGSEHKEKVAERINEHLWLGVNKVYAGFVSNGEVENIIDPELNLIQQERIDTISSVINSEFDFLFQLETD